MTQRQSYYKSVWVKSCRFCPIDICFNVYLEFKYNLPEFSVHVSQRNTIFGFGLESDRK